MPFYTPLSPFCLLTVFGFVLSLQGVGVCVFFGRDVCRRWSDSSLFFTPFLSLPTPFSLPSFLHLLFSLSIISYLHSPSLLMQQHREQSLARVRLLGSICQQLCGKPCVPGATLTYDAGLAQFSLNSEGSFEKIKSDGGGGEKGTGAGVVMDDDEDTVEMDDTLSLGFSDDEDDMVLEMSGDEEEEEKEAVLTREKQEEEFDIEQLKVHNVFCSSGDFNWGKTT